MEGKRLGPYRIESELGSGGMGKVWLAEAVEPGAVSAGTRVALKVVHPHLLAEAGFFKRFLREAEIGKSVAHPNVVRCLDCDQLVVDGTAQAFLVMEYVEGQTLRDLLDDLETVPEELCRHIGREIARGLAAIHEAGVVHRDLKPENVLITPVHGIKVMDLGVARLAGEAIRLSLTGAFVGSVRYASPEQFDGSEPDGRADLFSLGVILYELASGAHPHPGDDFAAVLASVRDRAPRRLGARNPQVSAFFEEVVHALLAKDRAGRFESAAKLGEVLTRGEDSTWWGRRARALRAETRRPLRRIRIPRETAVHGREDEIAALRDLYERAKDGDGRVVLVEGEAGIGKSRLVDELVTRLERDGEDVNFLFGSYPPGGAATAAGAWSTAYREHFGAEGLEETLEEYLTVTPALIPAFAALLRGEPPPDGTEPLTKDSIQTVFVHATTALADERPTVVLVEDLHFAPEEGRAMFASLALAAPDHRILLVGTTRPGGGQKWRVDVDRLPQASRMELGRLGPKDLTRLLIDAFQSERLAEELAFRIARKSDGNPFFVFEIIRGLREGKFITRRPDGTWVTTKVIEEIEIPSSVKDLIQARIADLTGEEQETLDVAACLGFTFDPTLVAEVLGRKPVPALRRFAHLERVHRLVRSVGRDYAFDHHQVQEALYAGMNEHLREQYHAAIGDALAARHSEPTGAAAVDLCEHLFLGGAGERARPHLEPALDHLEKGYLNDRAIALADRALAVPGLLQGPERMEILLRKAERVSFLGRREAQQAALDEALALADGPLARARVLTALGSHLHDTSRLDEAREPLAEAIDLAREAGDGKLEASATSYLGQIAREQGRFDEARALHERQLALAREIGDRHAEAAAVSSLGSVLFSLGRYEEATEHHEQGIASFRRVGDRRAEAADLSNLGLVAWMLGRYEEAQEHYRQSLAISREIGDRQTDAKATNNLGILLMALGRYEEAKEHYLRFLGLCREIGFRVGEVMGTVNLGLALSSLGRYGDALEQFERALPPCGETGDRETEATTLVNLGGLRAMFGDYARARENLVACLAICREIGSRRVEGYALHGLGLVAEAEGDREAGIRYLEESVALRKELEQHPAVVESLSMLGGLLERAGRVDEARTRLEESVALGNELGFSKPDPLSCCLLAVLPGGDVSAALEAIERRGEGLSTETQMDARFLLWRATGDRTHLEEARRLLRHLVEHAPPEYRESMVENVPLLRAVTDAAKGL